MSEIEILKKRIEELEKMLPKKRPSYEHHCPYCGVTWRGWKESIKECTTCKRRLDFEKKGPVVVQTWDNAELCKKFDEYIRRKEVVEKDFKPAFNRRLVFRALPEGIQYIKYVDDKEVENKLLNSSYEIMKDWDLTGFFKKWKDFQSS